MFCVSRKLKLTNNFVNVSNVWKRWSKFGLLAVFTFLFLSFVEGTSASEEPEFAEPIENTTVPAGREVKLACAVKNLGSHKVAWIHYDRSAILTVQNHVITRNPRITVSHDKHRAWFLHIHDVQEGDKGRYMCQINTPAAKTQFGYLHIVVPPNIDDSLSSSDVIIRENSNVTLFCHATGSPPPVVKWQREDKQEIKINQTLAVKEWEGDSLHMSKISRLYMGAYMCIASNGVHPAVSKRIKVSVDFPPMLWIPHQLVGAPLGYSVTLECSTEAYPTSLNYWTRDDGQMIHENKKYHQESIQATPAYKTDMKLTIFNIEERDFGSYKCVAKNPRGETDGSIRLYVSTPPSTIPPPTTTEIIIPKKPQDQTWEKNENLTLYRSPSSLTVGEKGNQYQSSLNQIGKAEQKVKNSGKGGQHFDWPSEEAATDDSSSTMMCFSIVLGVLSTFCPFLI